MLVLAIRSDKPEAEIYLLEDGKVIVQKNWQAHRMLAATISKQLRDVLNDKQHSLSDISGIVFYEGPGSFTGLRIGASVANALANSLGVRVTGAGGDDWMKTGIESLTGNDEPRIELVYGSTPHITVQRK